MKNSDSDDINMRIKVISAGSSKWERFIRRWGISFLIGEDVLFDTFGDTDVFLNNIRKFHVDTAKIRHIILSHDDWDHITGLWHLIPGRKDITVYICPGFKQEIKDKIALAGVKLVEAGKMMQIKDNIYSTGELSGESGGRIRYEHSVVIKNNGHLTLICGCAHPGAVNIIKNVKQNFNQDVYSLIGGFHLKDNDDETNLTVVKDLKELGVQKIAPMHCTGRRAVRMIRKAFGKGFIKVKEGGTIAL